MDVITIYYGTQLIEKVYHNYEIVFKNNSVLFHKIEDGKLIILGYYDITEKDGLYIDCVPKKDWIYPVQNGNVLTIEQVYSATQNGNVLEVE